jgi:hypothetical protein
VTPGRAWAAAIAAFAILAAWHNPVFYWFYAALGLLLLCGSLLVVAISRGEEIAELKAEIERRDREDTPPAGLSDRMVEGTRARLRVVEQRQPTHDHLADDDDFFGRLYGRDDEGNLL